jgi:capsular polysaccharide biosynthesis protein
MLINPNEVIQVKNLILPNETSYSTGNYHDLLFHELRLVISNQINKHIEKGTTPSRKIYISRRSNSRRKVLNENELYDMILQRGFEILNFDDIAWLDQVKICRCCSVMMSIHGAALTNMLFMPSGGQIIEFRRKEDNRNNCYFSLANACQHEYFYLVGDNNNVQKKIIGDYEIIEADIIISPKSLDNLLNSFF